MGAQGVMSVFAYGYRPMIPANENDGGFTVNLLENDQLVFSQMNRQNQTIRSLVFPLPATVRIRYLNLVNYARPWLRNVPLHLCSGDGSDSMTQYSFGFCGYPLLRIDDMPLLLDSPFRTTRGHYARLVYGLMEDVSTLLLPCGINLLPYDFLWDPKRIQPLIPPQYNTTYA